MQNEAIIVIAAVIIVLLFIGVMFLLALFYFNNKKRRMQEEKRHREAAYAEELLKTRLEIQEETFRNISQEIHDNIGQSLSLVKLTIATARPQDIQQVTAVLENSHQLVSKAIKDLRQLSHSLSPDFLNTIGLPGVIAQQLQQLEKTRQYTTQFTITGDPEKFNLQKEMVLLRIVQELLHNTIKHAKATVVSVEMAYQAGQLMVTVKDNGVGFDTTRLSMAGANRGIGLLNMQKRVDIINGTISITSNPGDGTTAVILVHYQ